MATVAVTGAIVTVSAVARGTATVTVTATDTEGSDASQSFAATVPNRAPLAAEAVNAQTVKVGDTTNVDMSPLFMDPDGDALTYSATASDIAVAEVSIAEGMLSVTAAGKGETTITVTATDTDGLTAAQSFPVTVPNQPPLAVEPIPAQVVTVGDTAAVDLAPFFADPDGDALTFAATTADGGTVSVSVMEGRVMLSPVKKGQTTITVTATDTDGVSVTQEFPVTVPNSAPEAVGSIAQGGLRVDSVALLNAAPFFADPDGDALVYAAVTSDPGVAAVAVTGAIVTVSAVARGTATVTVTATDTEGSEASQSFAATVPNRAPLAASRPEAQSIDRHDEQTFVLSEIFSDPDGDALSFEAVSSNSHVLTATIADGVLTLTGRYRGTVTVTVTASDPEGLSVAYRISVTVVVRNQPPLVTATIPSRSILTDRRLSIALGDFFHDPDGNPLSYRAVSSNTSVVTAAVSGSELELRAGTPGRAIVTITAEDPHGLGVSQDVTVVVSTRGDNSNQPPHPVGDAPAPRLEESQTGSLDVSAYFTDPDDDPLKYSATSSNTNVVGVSMSGSELELEARNPGTAEVSVDATDPAGLSAQMSFPMTVLDEGSPNLAPTGSTIRSQNLKVDASTTLDASGYFTDPNGDDLTFSAASSNTRVVTATLSGSSLQLDAVAAGTATITLTAEDPEGLSASSAFTVTVTALDEGSPNLAPTGSTVRSQYLKVDASTTLDASGYFTDPNGDDLTFSAASSNTGVVTATLSGSSLQLDAVAAGTATVTLTAEDPEGLSASSAFTVTVTALDEDGPNLAPTSSTVGSQDLKVDESTTLDASGYFTDPNGDDLTFSAASSNTGVVTATLSGSSLQLDAVAAGTATVTLTAEDPEGLSASSAFTVTVTAKPPPGAPKVTKQPTPETIVVGGEYSVLSRWYITDPDHTPHDLTTTVTSSNTSVIQATASDTPFLGDVTLVGLSPGTATITITVTDPDDLSASVSVVHTVGNNAPIRKLSVPDVTRQVGDSVQWFMMDWTVFRTGAFRDDDIGDELSFDAWSSDPSVATARARLETFYFGDVRAVSVGQATIVATATDLGGLSVADTFVVTVEARSTSSAMVQNDPGLGSARRAAGNFVGKRRIPAEGHTRGVSRTKPLRGRAPSLRREQR